MVRWGFEEMDVPVFGWTIRVVGSHSDGDPYVCVSRGSASSLSSMLETVFGRSFSHRL